MQAENLVFYEVGNKNFIAQLVSPSGKNKKITARSLSSKSDTN